MWSFDSDWVYGSVKGWEFSSPQSGGEMARRWCSRFQAGLWVVVPAAWEVSGWHWPPLYKRRVRSRLQTHLV